MPTVINLTTLTPAQGFIVQGNSANVRTGQSVSNAGDVNGDGIDDLIIGGPGPDEPGTTEGVAYVVFGRTTGFGGGVGGRQVIDVTALSAADGFIIQGDAAGDFAGGSVSGAGDVNGDGIGDLIVGAFRGDDGGNYAGEAYVIFGRTTGFGSPVGGRQVIDLTSVSAIDGFVIQGDMERDLAGGSVSGAGDVNGDGVADLIVGASRGSDGGSAAGEAYVIFGRTAGFGSAVGGRQVIDLTSLSTSDGFIIQGDTAGDQAGGSVSNAGDVNGDGIDDLIVGSLGGDDGGSYAGEAYVIFGRTTGFGSTVGGRQVIDLTSLSASDGFIIQGDAAFENTGGSVSNAGDVNGDGIDDLIVGAARGSDGGKAYVIFGRATGFGTAVGGRQVIDLTSLSASDGFIIKSAAVGDFAGGSVSGAGDVNGDGVGDLIVGADRSNGGANLAGEAYVIFGRTTGFGTAVGGRQVIDLTNLSTTDGFSIRGDAAGDQAGGSVSNAGDVNKDGIADLIIGATGGDDGGAGAGEAYVIYGTAAAPPPSTVRGTNAGETLTGNGGNNVILGFGGNDVIDGAGGNDVIVGGAGNDAISGGTGLNELIGGTGDDIYIVTAATDSIIELAGEGFDEIQTALAVMVARAGVEILRFTDGARHVGVGIGQADQIIGGTGADELIGRGGDDVLRGGTGAANALVGGSGDDTYFVDAVGDSVIETAGEGTDNVVTTLTQFLLRSEVENIAFAGTGNFTGVGNGSANVMTGGAGDDFLSGLDGDDVMTGGAGRDLLIGGAGADIFRFGGGETSIDRVFDFVSGTDKIALDSAAFTRTTTISYVAGTAATTTNSTLFYNADIGILSYDADGTGAAAAVAIANMGGGAVLAVGDFIFV